MFVPSSSGILTSYNYRATSQPIGTMEWETRGIFHGSDPWVDLDELHPNPNIASFGKIVMKDDQPLPRKFQHPNLKLETSGMDTVECDSIYMTHELIRSWWISPYQKVEKTSAGHR